jgi:cysteinyl-tRNA synthetase
MLDRLYGAIRGIDVSDVARQEAQPPDALVAALEDDLNSPKAMAALFDVVRTLNKASDAGERASLAAVVYAAGDLMGLLQSDPEEWFAGHVDGEISADEVEAILEKRRVAKADKDFKAADGYRDQLAEAGIRIEDGPDGTSWRRQ